MSKSYYRGLQKRPKPIGTEEWKSFLNFAKLHYKNAVELSVNVVVEKCGPMSSITELGKILLSSLLDKTCSPLVYIWEEWQLLKPQDKLKYATEEYRKFLEKTLAESGKVKEQIEQELSGKKEAAPQ